MQLSRLLTLDGRSVDRPFRCALRLLLSLDLGYTRPRVAAYRASDLLSPDLRARRFSRAVHRPDVFEARSHTATLPRTDPNLSTTSRSAELGTSFTLVLNFCPP